MTITDRLEPGAGDFDTIGDAALASLAISMKRIADALWDTEGQTGLVHILHDIEMNTRRNAL